MSVVMDQASTLKPMVDDTKSVVVSREKPTYLSLLNLRPAYKVMLFIDGALITSRQGQGAYPVDLTRFRNLFVSGASLVRIMFYATSPFTKDGVGERRGLIDFLQFNGFTVVDVEYDDDVEEGESAEEQLRLKKVNARLARNQLDQYMLVDLVDAAHSVPDLDMVYLMTANPNVTRAISILKAKGIRVGLLGYHQSSKMFDSIRRACDLFVPMSELRPFCELPNKDMK